MPAGSQEYRHHAQEPHAIGVKRRRALRQRRPHQFEEREHDALARQPLAEFGYELLERARPVGVARAVGEEDDGVPCHALIIAEAR